MMKNHMFLEIKQDSNGYPPVASERVWINMLDEGIGIVDSIPFFSRDVSLGDVVKVEKVSGIFKYISTIKHSGNSLVRVVYYKESDIGKIRNHIQSIGCDTELFLDYHLISINVPRGHLRELQKFLKAQKKMKILGYEEAILFE